MSAFESLRSKWTPVWFTILLSASAFGQAITSASIRGRVTDETGSSVPGTRITASSPALLIRETTAVTDINGEYRFAELPIGTYKITYQREGFQQLIRENVVLTAGFTATLDINLKVGSVSDNVTVEAESPLVDTTQTTTGTDLSAKVLTDVIPTTRNAVEYLSTTPGVVRANRPDFGGGTSGGGQYAAYGIQGQMNILLDGVNTTQSVINQGTGNGPDFSSLEELQVVPFAGNAETPNPGVMLNMIVKSGGNQFPGRYEATGETKAVQADNLTRELRALPNFTVGQGINSYETVNADLGAGHSREALVLWRLRAPAWGPDGA